jgi:hypothetical protein
MAGCPVYSDRYPLGFEPWAFAAGIFRDGWKHLASDKHKLTDKLFQIVGPKIPYDWPSNTLRNCKLRRPIVFNQPDVAKNCSHSAPRFATGKMTARDT